MKKITLLLLLLNVSFLFAQKEITGTVKDNTGSALPSVNITEKGTTNGVATDIDGTYKIKVKDGATLVISSIGFLNVEKNVGNATKIDVVLTSGGQELKEIQIVGSRNTKRTVVNSAVPIDIISMKELTTQSGKIEINQLLQYVAPSFNANKQSGSDGADHVDPASLRGMGPDQTLVLINGKRRHQSSLVTIYGTRGRGNTGTDLNAIPASAIKRIEILRDGAAAQYGSDAIAGVINIVLNDNVNELTGAITYGAFNTAAKGDFPNGTANTKNFRLDENGNGNSYGRNRALDGNTVKVGANYGVALGKDGGFVNFTTEFFTKEKVLRPGFDYRKGFGEASMDSYNFTANMELPISEKSKFYAFAGKNYRDTDAYAFTRNSGKPNVVEAVYPGGYTPRITSIVLDNSVTAGIKTTTDSGWKVDISNTYGKNLFHYTIKGTMNPSLLLASPLEFDAGGHSLAQNTTNFDFSKNYDTILQGMNIAFGAEYRIEEYNIFAGQEGSYTTYDTNRLPIIDPATQSPPIDPVSGKPRPGSSQGFPGYSPSNAVNKNRSNLSLYTDAEFDITKSFMVSGAVRFEKYSDFGSTINGKLASRLKLADNINLRGSVSTGFRAPSLVQSYYGLHFTNIDAGGATEILLSPNDSPVTRSFGIQKLKQETAVNTSLGLTANFSNFTATIDGYMINVKDRIVLTSYFDASSKGLGVDQTQFFANAADTKTLGLDLVLAWKKKYGDSNVSATLVGNINDMTIGKVNNGSLDAETFFGKREQAFLLASAPKNKFGLNLNFDKKWFNAGLAFTRFSEVKLLDYQMDEDVADYASFADQVKAATDTYSAKITTDLTLGFKLSKSTKLSLGANNLFNIYPDQQDDWVEAGGYWDAVQMGFNGAYYYARLGFNF